MKNEKQSEVDKFFEGLPSQDEKVADVFNDKPEAKSDNKEPEKGDDNTEVEVRKNRQQRRLEQKYQQERESNIILAERLRVATETEDTIKKNPDIEARLIRMFGTTEEGKELAKHFTDLLAENKEEARDEALRELSKLETVDQVEVAKEENYIDSQLEAIEDAYGVDITSETPQATKRRQEFLGLVEKLSPKGEGGIVTDYADFGTTYELYDETHKEKIDNSRQKEIASRSMTRSGSAKSAERTATPGFRGWERDYGLN